VSLTERSPNIDQEFEYQPKAKELFDSIDNRFEQAIMQGRDDLITSDGEVDLQSHYLRLMQADSGHLKLYLGYSTISTEIKTLLVEVDDRLASLSPRSLSDIKQTKSFMLVKTDDEVAVYEINELDPNNPEESLPHDLDGSYEWHEVWNDTQDNPVLHSRIIPKRQQHLLDMVERATYPPEAAPTDISIAA
jgi:hypothetical protein